MKLSTLSDLSQIIAGIAVIGSLLFIGIEINQNTKATRASIRQSIASNDITFLSTFLNSEIIAEASAKIIDNRELNTKETEQLVWQQYVNFMVFETTFYNYKQGLLDNELWDRYQIIIANNMQTYPFAKEAWKRFKITFTKSFQEEVRYILGNIYVQDDSFYKDSFTARNDSTNIDSEEIIDTTSKVEVKR